MDFNAMLSTPDRAWLESRPEVNAVPDYEALIADVGYGGLSDRDLSTTQIAAVVRAAEKGQFVVDRSDDKNVVYRNAVWFSMLMERLRRMATATPSKEELEKIRQAMLGVASHMDSAAYRSFGNGALERFVLSSHNKYFDILLSSYDAEELLTLGYKRELLEEQVRVLKRAVTGR